MGLLVESQELREIVPPVAPSLTRRCHGLRRPLRWTEIQKVRFKYGAFPCRTDIGWQMMQMLQ
jgi:hypothetical protein